MISPSELYMALHHHHLQRLNLDHLQILNLDHLTRAVAASEDDRELGHRRTADGHDHLGAVLGDAALLELRTHHEARDVMKKHQGDAALPADLAGHISKFAPHSKR